MVDLTETSILCANGDCHRQSTVNEIEKLKAYILYLEQNPKPRMMFIDYPTILVKTPNGCRTVRQNDFNSIQWALTQNIKDLK
jgi:hypothetical protein